jgi:hypothetical protein
MGANQLAAQRTGKALDPVSVGDLFAGAFLSGLATAGLYILYIPTRRPDGQVIAVSHHTAFWPAASQA